MCICLLCFLDMHKNRNCVSYLIKVHSKQKLCKLFKIKAVTQVGDSKLYFSPLKQANKKSHIHVSIHVFIITH